MSFLEFSAFAQILSAAVTAVATVALWRATRQLTIETKILAERSSDPFVIASLDASPWAINHIELKVLNSGNATAFDIEIDFSPPLPLVGALAEQQILSKLNALKPGQSIGRHIGSFVEIEQKTYKVTSSWSKKPGLLDRDSLTYDIDLNQYMGTGILGGDPLIAIAQESKKIREQLARR